MLLTKSRLKRLITLDCNEYVLFTDQIFYKTLDRVLVLKQCFEALKENQKLGRVFEKIGRVFKKLGRVFMFKHGPCCPDQPR